MSCHAQVRVNELTSKSRRDELVPDESAWLEAHLEQCQPCSSEIAAVEIAVSRLRASGPTASLRLVRATQLRCRQRALELEKRNRRMRPLAMACILACGWATLALPFLWEQLSEFSENSHSPDLWVHVVFLLMWFMPAMLGVAVALWLRPQLSAENSMYRPEETVSPEVAACDRRLRA